MRYRNLGPVSKLAAAVLMATSCWCATASADDDNLLQTIKDRGVMRVCDAEYNPWNVKNPVTNEWEGVDVDIVNLIAEQLKVKVEHVDSTFATLYLNMKTKKCDFAAAAVYVSAARAEVMSYTRTFAKDGTAIFVPADSPAKTIADLDKPGKTIVVRSGTVEEPIAKQVFKQATVRVLTADSAVAHLLEIASGHADAGLASLYGNLVFLKKNPNMKVRPLNDDLLRRTSVGFAVPAREYFFRDYLSASILTLEDNGTIKQILDKWFK